MSTRLDEKEHMTAEKNKNEGWIKNLVNFIQGLANVKKQIEDKINTIKNVIKQLGDAINNTTKAIQDIWNKITNIKKEI